MPGKLSPCSHMLPLACSAISVPSSAKMSEPLKEGVCYDVPFRPEYLADLFSSVH